ncbi:MAG: hypothetical protein MUF54_09415, partial [Polyangiaceae bacterium]|nr:hypothetical protein [Polyangiaceae bacterium]
SAISGLPVPGSADWCDPMPELGDPCTEDLKRCAIVCDYISDTCAMLVCTSGMWDYVEHGGDASSSGN